MRMETIRIFVAVAAVFLLLTFSITEGTDMDALKISSTAFENNGSIPGKYTCDGANVSPPLRIQNVPAGTKSLALIVDDPDAPGGMWVHWVVWNIDPGKGELEESEVPAGSVQGINDFETYNYGGPCPPSGTHRYFFKLYALDTTLSFSADSGKAGLERAMKGHIVAQGQIVGRYKRK
jgi:Raf kinase inhibitor-like YbhB/YbcL family protein